MVLLGWMAVGALTLAGLYAFQMVHLSVVLRWEDEKTRGLGYYGLPPAGRLAFKRTLRRHARFLYPILRLSSRSAKFSFQRASFRYQDVAGPRGSCTPESFAQAHHYQAGAADVFVATQMKCGTTWMQHVVYEVLHRGQGHLVESGATLYGVSPWIEGVRSVPLAEAPLLGTERPSRLIKTHLPAHLCPRSTDARYIYVARHPVSCFASCHDFLATNAGAMAPSLALMEEWFCSRDQMWWGSWPDHVDGWWNRSREDANVLLVYFEDMKRDLAGTVRTVADFLGLQPLAPAESARVVEKCGFAYMQEHQSAFEMQPPHLLQTDAELFVRGSADRHRDVAAAVRDRVAAWCAAELAGRASHAELARRYPELAAARAAPLSTR